MADPKLPFGILNPIAEKSFPKRINNNLGNNFDALKNAIRKQYENHIGVDGQYIGYVLKTEENGSENDGISRLGNIWDKLSPLFSQPETQRVKVRIPEIHSHIPEPEDFNDFALIDLHDTFDVPRDVGSLSPGTFVYVSIYDSSGAYAPTVRTRLTDAQTALFESTLSAKEKLEETNTGPSGAYEVDFREPANEQKPNRAPVPKFNEPPIGPVPPQPKKPTKGKTELKILPAQRFKENRIRITKDGISEILNPNSPLLVPVPKTQPGKAKQKLHILVYNRFEALRLAALQDGIEIYVNSGWREGFANRREYDVLVEQKINDPKHPTYYKKFMKNGVNAEEAKKIARKEVPGWIAYKSPHMTGCAVDFYIKDPYKTIRPVSATNDKQKKTRSYKWLVDNAHLYGFTPYTKEAWHWEVLLPIEAWQTGQEYTNNYAVRIVEKSIRNGTTTNTTGFSL